MKAKISLPAGVAVFAFLALAGLMGLFALTAAPSAEAQEDSTTIEHPENSEDPVATFTATDPEGVTPITWSVLASDVTDDPIGVNASVDSADALHFAISKEGVLTFDIGGDADAAGNVSPDFEAPRGTDEVTANNTNTYKVVVAATDAEFGGVTGYHKVTVMVTDVDEDGEVSWTVDADGTGGADTPKLRQFQVGASLIASVEDGDISGTNKIVDGDRTDVETDPTWRWYRSPSKTSMGTMIDGAESDTYPVTTADVDMYLRAVAYYVVTGNVGQETASLTSDYPVLAVRPGSNELEFAPAEVELEVAEGEKGAEVGAPVTATGNYGAVNYTLVTGVTGNDDDKFKIDQKTGQITTAVDLDYDEMDTSAADQCEIRNSCVVTVRATDAFGSATGGVNAGDPADATVTIKLTDVDEKPEFTTGDSNDPMAKTVIEVPENYIALSTSTNFDENDVTYTATDPEDRSLTYRLMGPDGAKFELDVSKVLSFEQKPDYENPTDRNKDNVYEVTVRASAGTLYADRMVKVTVINEDDAPAVMGRDSISYDENGEDPVETFTATDPEGATSITWSLPTTAPNPPPDGFVAADFTGSDAEHFDLDDEDGVLTFAIGTDDDPPDFEAPRELDFNAASNTNTYKVVVAACDVTADNCEDGETGYHKVTIMVTDVAEAGEVTWTVDPDGATVDTLSPADVNDGEPIMQFQVGATLTASVTDGDMEGTTKTVANPTWQWYKGGSLITTDDADDETYTVTTADVGRSLRAKATYILTGNTNQETASLTSDYPVLAVRAGDHELKFAPAEVELEVAEGKKGAEVGTVTATGNHGAVNYTLTDDDDAAKFKIDQKTGQITTAMDLDYDARRLIWPIIAEMPTTAKSRSGPPTPPAKAPMQQPQLSTPP